MEIFFFRNTLMKWCLKILRRRAQFLFLFHASHVKLSSSLSWFPSIRLHHLLALLPLSPRSTLVTVWVERWRCESQIGSQRPEWPPRKGSGDEKVKVDIPLWQLIYIPIFITHPSPGPDYSTWAIFKLNGLCRYAWAGDGWGRGERVSQTSAL